MSPECMQPECMQPLRTAWRRRPAAHLRLPHPVTLLLQTCWLTRCWLGGHPRLAHPATTTPAGKPACSATARTGRLARQQQASRRWAPRHRPPCGAALRPSAQRRPPPLSPCRACPCPRSPAQHSRCHCRCTARDWAAAPSRPTTQRPGPWALLEAPVAAACRPLRQPRRWLLAALAALPAAGLPSRLPLRRRRCSSGRRAWWRRPVPTQPIP